MKSDRSLEQTILVALQQAQSEGRREVAEHLLAALERLCADSEPDEAAARIRSIMPGRPLS